MNIGFKYSLSGINNNFEANVSLFKEFISGISQSSPRDQVDDVNRSDGVTFNWKRNNFASNDIYIQPLTKMKLTTKCKNAVVRSTNIHEVKTFRLIGHTGLGLFTVQKEALESSFLSLERFETCLWGQPIWHFAILSHIRLRELWHLNLQVQPSTSTNQDYPISFTALDQINITDDKPKSSSYPTHQLSSCGLDNYCAIRMTCNRPTLGIVALTRPKTLPTLWNHVHYKWEYLFLQW